MNLAQAIARGLTLLASAYGREYTTTDAEVWLELLGDCDPVAVLGAVRDYCQGDHEFPPRPGQIRQRALAALNPDAGLTPEQMLDRGVADPEGFWGLVCRRAGALRCGERYDDGTGSWFAASETGDPIGRATARRAVADAWAALEQSPGQLAELRARAALGPGPARGIGSIGDALRELGEGEE